MLGILMNAPGASARGSPRNLQPSTPHARGRLQIADFIGFASTPMLYRLLRNRVPRDRAGRSIHRLWFVKELICVQQMTRFLPIA
jgi:hypothetical protein